MVKMKRAIDILVGLSMWDSFMLFGTVAVPMDDGTNGWVKNMQNANINHKAGIVTKKVRKCHF